MAVPTELDPPLSPGQRSKIRRLSTFKEPAAGEEMGELNIVPYLDIIMNIIVFVIASLVVVFTSTIDTTPPSAGGQKGTRMATKALNLTALITTVVLAYQTSNILYLYLQVVLITAVLTNPPITWGVTVVTAPVLEEIRSRMPTTKVFGAGGPPGAP